MHVEYFLARMFELVNNVNSSKIQNFLLMVLRIVPYSIGIFILLIKETFIIEHINKKIT